MIENLEGEIWKDINGFEGRYQVSNMGRVKSLAKEWETNIGKRWHDDMILKPALSVYLTVTLLGNGIKLRRHVHQLVADHFIPNPLNLPCINHLKTIYDNGVDDLERCTFSRNAKYEFDIGRRVGKRGSDNKCSKTILNLQTGVFYECTEDAAFVVGVTKNHMRRMLRGERTNKTSMIYV